MRWRSTSVSWLLLAALALCATTPVQAQLFQPLDPFARWINLYGSATVQGSRDGQTAFKDLYQFKVWPTETAGFFGTFDVTDHLVLDVVSPDNTAAAHVEAFTSHVSFVGPELISFEALITASASTSGRPGPQTVGSVGGPGRADFIGMYFDVKTPITAVLSLHADVARGGGFNFSLADISNDGFVPVFEQSASSDMPVIAPHQLTLDLAAGRYRMLGELTGVVGLNEQGSFSAGFSLQALPVPEPQSWLLLVVGAPLIFVFMGRARRPAR